MTSTSALGLGLGLDHVLLEVDAWLRPREKRDFCLACRAYWALLFKAHSAVVVDLRGRAGWRAPLLDFQTKLPVEDFSRLIIVQPPRHADDAEEMMRDMRQRQYFTARRLPQLLETLPNLRTMDLWGRACALRHHKSIVGRFRIRLHDEPRPPSTRRSTRARRKSV